MIIRVPLRGNPARRLGLRVPRRPREQVADVFGLPTFVTGAVAYSTAVIANYRQIQQTYVDNVLLPLANAYVARRFITNHRPDVS